MHPGIRFERAIIGEYPFVTNPRLTNDMIRKSSGDSLVRPASAKQDQIARLDSFTDCFYRPLIK